MIETNEGYLICKDVKIGRIGYMDYLGSELPADFNEPFDKVCRVGRTAEELFSDETVASFEFKSVTNTHPSNNLDIKTVEMSEKGQISNVRPDGDYLIADLCVKDPLLIDQIKSGNMREVSCGYDCSWHKISEGKYEQREIRGNHLAIVKLGRAGPKVAIQDSKPDSKPKNGGKRMGKMSKSFLTALGFKHYAQDAEPEDIAKAMDAMNEEEEKEEKPAKDAEKPISTGVETKDASGDTEEDPRIAQMEAKVDKLIAIVEKLVESDKEVHKEVAADKAMDALEKELGEEGKEAKDEKPEDEETKEDEVKETKEEQAKEDKEGTEKHKFAADAAFKKFVKDMKPAIMAIPDEKVRNEMATAFCKSVRDSRSIGYENGYADILKTVSKNKHAAMDKAMQSQASVADRAEKSCNAWKAVGEKLKGGNQ